MRCAGWLVFSLCMSCGASRPPPAPGPAPARPPIVETIERGVIHRTILDETLSAGLGRFLQRVETEPAFSDGEFVGFRLVNLTDTALFAGSGIEVGDVVLSVNGRPVERPEDALEVWSSLSVASEVVVVVQRGEAAHELRFPILD